MNDILGSPNLPDLLRLEVYFGSEACKRVRYYLFRPMQPKYHLLSHTRDPTLVYVNKYPNPLDSVRVNPEKATSRSIPSR